MSLLKIYVFCMVEILFDGKQRIATNKRDFLSTNWFAKYTKSYDKPSSENLL